MAAAFPQARTTHCVLLIDEIYSFLQERGKAHNGWKVTLGNFAAVARRARFARLLGIQGVDRSPATEMCAAARVGTTGEL